MIDCKLANVQKKLLTAILIRLHGQNYLKNLPIYPTPASLPPLNYCHPQNLA